MRNAMIKCNEDKLKNFIEGFEDDREYDYKLIGLSWIVVSLLIWYALSKNYICGDTAFALWIISTAVASYVVAYRGIKIGDNIFNIR